MTDHLHSIAERREVTGTGSFIAGRWWPGSGDAGLDVIDSFTEQPMARHRFSSVEDVDNAVRAAREAFPVWSETPVERRVAHVRAIAAALAEEWMRPYDMNRRADYQTRYSYFPAAPKPIIAAINGAAAGLGMIMALFSDFRIASEKAVFTTAFAKRGLIAEHGIAWILPRVVGHAAAIDLLLTSRRVTAQEALSLGLVGQLTPPEDLLNVAHELARALSSEVSPRSIRVMKRQLWEAPYQPLGAAIALANGEMVESLRSEDFREGVAHFIEKRAARFTGR